MNLFSCFNKSKMKLSKATSSKSTIENGNRTSNAWIKMDMIKIKYFRLLKWIADPGNIK